METQIFNIDSRFRDTTLYPNSTNYVYSIPNEIKNIVEVKLSSLEYGNTSYVFTSEKGNNTFTIDDGSPTGLIFTLTPGNYTPEELVAEINAWLALHCSNITLILDTNTGKVTFTSSTDEFTLEFPSIDDYKSLGEMLGFTGTDYTSSGFSLTAENIINVMGEHYYFLKLNELGKVYNKNQKYFCKFIVDAPKFEVTYESRNIFVTKAVTLEQPINTQKLKIQVYDVNNNIVDHNGFEFSFTLEMKVVRNDTLKKYKEMTFDTLELKKLVLYDKMLQYYDNKMKDSKDKRSLGTIYHKLIQKL
jgi:hypothetical protein